MSIVYSPEERNTVKKHWYNADQLLIDMQQMEPFRGRTRWCDLSPVHFKLLLTRNIDQVFVLLDEAEMTGQSLEDANDDLTISSMNFLLMAYAECVEAAADCHIQNINITRHDINELTMVIMSAVDSNYKTLGPVVPKITQPAFKLISNENDE